MWWHKLRAALSDLTSLRDRGRAEQQQSQARAHVAELLRQQPAAGASHSRGFHSQAWRAKKAKVGSMTRVGLGSMLVFVATHAATAERRAVYQQRESFAGWIAEMAGGHMRAIHAIIKTPLARGAQLRTEADFAADVAAQLRAKEAHWQNLWHPIVPGQDEVSELHRGMREALEEAGPSPLPRLTLEQWRRVFRSFRATAGRGLGRLGPSDSLDLPDAAFLALSSLMAGVEDSGMWPWQVLANLVVLSSRDCGAAAAGQSSRTGVLRIANGGTAVSQDPPLCAQPFGEPSARMRTSPQGSTRRARCWTCRASTTESLCRGCSIHPRTAASART